MARLKEGEPGIQLLDTHLPEGKTITGSGLVPDEKYAPNRVPPGSGFLSLARRHSF